jgi:hypothetical protein
MGTVSSHRRAKERYGIDRLRDYNSAQEVARRAVSEPRSKALEQLRTAGSVMVTHSYVGMSLHRAA